MLGVCIGVCSFAGEQLIIIGFIWCVLVRYSDSGTKSVLLLLGFFVLKAMEKEWHFILKNLYGPIPYNSTLFLIDFSSCRVLLGLGVYVVGVPPGSVLHARKSMESFWNFTRGFALFVMFCFSTGEFVHTVCLCSCVSVMLDEFDTVRETMNDDPLGPLFSLPVPIPIPVHPLPFCRLYFQSGSLHLASHIIWWAVFEDISLTVQNVACKCVDLNCVVISGQWNITHKENNRDLF